MFQCRTFLPHCVTLFHPPDQQVSMDMLFESELFFAWGELADPHALKKVIGKFFPFAYAVLEGYKRLVEPELDRWRFSISPEKGRIVTGILVAGLNDELFARLDQYNQAPIRTQRMKVTCKIGELDRVAHTFFSQGALLEE